MKSTLFILIFSFLVISPVLKAQPNMVWEQRYNGPGNLQDNAYKIKCDNSGNIYITGRSIGNGTGYDFCTIKYTPDGSQVWLQRYNGPGNGEDGSVSIGLDNNSNVYITGYSFGSSGNLDFCTIKYDSNGNLIWIRRYDGGFDDRSVDLEIDVSGNIHITGSSRSSTSDQSDKYLTVKYDSNGNFLWGQKYDATIFRPDTPADLTLDVNGNVIVTGTSNSDGETWEDIATVKYNSAGDQLWVNRFSLPSNGASTDWGNAVISDNNGNVYVTGYSENFAGKMVTIKYSSNGIQQWYALYDSNAVDQGYDINVYGNFVYVTGYTGGRLLVVKYDSSGNLVWDRITREFQISIGYSSVVDNLGNIYTTGYCSGIPSTDCLTLKYDINGNLQWYKTYNGLRDSNDIANDLCLDNFGNLYVTGWSRGFNTNADFITLKYSNLTAIQPVTTELPAEYSLSQNYPNPFNPSTKIKFSIPNTPLSFGEGQGVGLFIYNSLGQQITTLINQQLTPGTYEVEWDASNFPSGLYFYQLTSGEYSETKKMILLK